MGIDAWGTQQYFFYTCKECNKPMIPNHIRCHCDEKFDLDKFEKSFDEACEVFNKEKKE